MDDSSPAPARTPATAHRVLVLQGGGALGSYQAGAYQALCHFDFEPEWIAGISIGAINAAIIAGNPREKRVGRLKEFWEMVSAPVPWNPVTKSDRGRSLFNETSAAVTAGQPAIRELLRHRAASKNAGAPGRFRPHQRPEDPAQHRRGECDHRQLQIFRQFRVQEARQEDRTGAYHGVGRTAAGLPFDRH